MIRDFDTWVAALTSAVETGTTIDLAQGLAGDEIDPAQGGGWPEDRQILGVAVRQALLTVSRPDPRGLTIRGAHVIGELDLAHVRVGYPVRLLACSFATPLAWDSFSAPELAFTGSKFTGTAGIAALTLDGAEVKGDAYLNQVKTTGEIRASGATIGGVLSLEDAELSNADGDVLILNQAEVKGGAFLDGVKTTGSIRALGATIGGHLSLHDAELSNADGDVLILDQAEVKVGAFLNRLKATGSIRALGATIGGQLNLNDAELSNADGDVLILDQAEVKGGAFLDGLKTTGSIRAPGATIGGVLSLDGAELSNPDGDVLNLDQAEVKGSAFLNRVRTTGEIRALGATIDGVFSLHDAELFNADGEVLSLDRAEVKGGAVLKRVKTTGRIRALGAIIGGQLTLSDAELFNPDGDVLILDQAEVKAGAFLNGLKTTGRIRALGATFGGQLNLKDAELSNADGYALALQDANVKGAASLEQLHVTGRVDLRSARFGVLVTATGFRADTLNLSGWSVADLHGELRHDRRTAARFLELATTRGEFAPQPWRVVADIYDRNGEPADARWLRRKAAWGVTKVSPATTRISRTLYGTLVGHGYSPLRASIWLVAVLLATIVLIIFNQAAFSPTNSTRTSYIPALEEQYVAKGTVPPVTGATPCEQLVDRSACLRPVLYALDNVLPGTLATGQAALWTPNATPLLAYIIGGLRVFAWVLVALLLAGVTGLLRKT